MVAGRCATALVAAVAVAAVLGCGGSKPADPAQTVAPDGHAPIPPRSELALPPQVPDRATGPATGESRRVINAWLRALRRGDVRRAAHYFALPSKFQNVTPVLTIDSEQERRAINESLSCGAVAIDMGAAGVYTIVTFRLTRRPGGECGSGVGGKARGAIRVERGKIKEWYRLPDRPGGPQQAPPAPSGLAA
jgi:limonene-1,2-epoxide hydrolase